MECGGLECRLTTNISSSFCESALQRARRPRKYEDSWFSGNKRIYLAKLMLKTLKAIKGFYRLSSNDAAAHHLISTYALF